MIFIGKKNRIIFHYKTNNVELINNELFRVKRYVLFVKNLYMPQYF